MTRVNKCLFFIFPVFFATVAGLVWASIFDQLLLAGIFTGLVAGIFIAAWFTNCMKSAKNENECSFKEKFSRYSMVLSLILFLDLFLSMLVWSYKELF